jgi:eukaryotic-like serine/threonine-protein kinase
VGRESQPGTVGPDGSTTPSFGTTVAGFRVLRRIAAGSRVDVVLGHADELTRTGGPSRAPGPDAGVGCIAALRVYRADVPPESIALEIEAMSRVQPGSLPTLSDVTTLDDGRVCLIVDRLGLSVAELLRQGELTPGEAVTVCAPVVVAIDRLHAAGFALGRLSAADVLLDEVGRPVVSGLGCLRDLEPSRTGAVERAEAVGNDYRDLAEFIDVVFARAGSDAGAGVSQWLRDRLAARPFLPCAAELERRIFEVAEAEPLRTHAPGVAVRALPVRVGAGAHEIPGAAGRSADASTELPARGRRRGVASFLEGLGIAPDETVERLGDALDAPLFTRLRGRFEALRRVRGRAVIVAGSVAAAVLVLALTAIPPGAGTEETPAEAIEAHQPAAGTVAPSGDADATPLGGAEVSDPAEAALRLLAERRRCLVELSLACLEHVVQPNSALSARDRTTIIGAQQGGAVSPGPTLTSRAASVVGDLGEAVIVELVAADPGTPPASALIVRGEEGWRLREVFGG